MIGKIRFADRHGGVIEIGPRAFRFDRRECPEFLRRGNKVSFETVKGRAINVRPLKV